jgi:hypothetical protein
MFSYWINKIEKIPSDWFSLSTAERPADIWVWLEGDEEASELHKAVKPYGILLWANDGVGNYKKFGDNPKDRIINFLKAIELNPSKYHYPWD